MRGIGEGRGIGGERGRTIEGWMGREGGGVVERGRFERGDGWERKVDKMMTTYRQLLQVRTNYWIRL